MLAGNVHQATHTYMRDQVISVVIGTNKRKRRETEINCVRQKLVGQLFYILRKRISEVLLADESAVQSSLTRTTPVFTIRLILFIMHVLNALQTSFVFKREFQECIRSLQNVELNVVHENNMLLKICTVSMTVYLFST